MARRRRHAAKEQERRADARRNAPSRPSLPSRHCVKFPARHALEPGERGENRSEKNLIKNQERYQDRCATIRNSALLSEAEPRFEILKNLISILIVFQVAKSGDGA